MAGLCQIGGIARCGVSEASSPRKRGAREVGATWKGDSRFRGNDGGGGQDCPPYARFTRRLLFD